MPIYVTVQWDQYTADVEPGWRIVTETGALQGTPPYEPGFYRRLCLNSPYVDFLKAHLAELFELVPVDGLFLDIVKARTARARAAVRRWTAEGLDPSNAQARQEFGARGHARASSADLTRFIRTLDRECRIFYNGGHIGPEQRAIGQRLHPLRAGVAAQRRLGLPPLPALACATRARSASLAWA